MHSILCDHLPCVGIKLSVADEKLIDCCLLGTVVSLHFPGALTFCPHSTFDLNPEQQQMSRDRSAVSPAGVSNIYSNRISLEKRERPTTGCRADFVFNKDSCPKQSCVTRNKDPLLFDGDEIIGSTLLGKEKSARFYGTVNQDEVIIFLPSLLRFLHCLFKVFSTTTSYVQQS